MDLAFSADDLQFQQEVRQFLAENLTADIVETTANNASVFVEKDLALQWQAILVEKGWAVPQWPTEHGGTGWTPTQKYIFSRECYLAGAPMLIPLGLLMLAPVIMAFGSEAQKQEYLPKILSGEHYWCQGYSEPGAGSDLAGLKLKAEADGDDYIVNGSKIWTTHAHLADHIFCLVRTSNEGRPQQGISFLLIDMATPGVSVEPIITMAGDHEVNQVFFDNVRVPQSNRIGGENKGWTYAKYLLEFERGGGFSGPLVVHELERLWDLYESTAAEVADFDSNEVIKRRIGQIEIDLKALEITELRILSAVSAGGAPGPESSILKLNTTRLEQAINEVSVDILGYRGLVMDSMPGASPYRPDPESAVLPRYLNNRAASIFGGSQEVQRNIVSKLVLGL
ncbi:acyl-CoA dehydrogenase [Halioglobus japonicus]|uniref:Acyl-CoA dehydrogenase n=1 Tax=Halioglobus japonicus TaxID=930805 RepID=A0AAP8MG79_9GAMM|nr:acyl-CoA dehydrogenase family protein [Halioglobus japonicus]AQA19636.1 acyl-CoA dehydrogenase [Halioglobus japonicus]PLW87293.1 acyl-CoA dehydrogenase [Halioglobus japonicus]GHD09163.1 acyl-CoA dehydrogenase [Halioglobus japonicus]